MIFIVILSLVNMFYSAISEATTIDKATFDVTVNFKKLKTYKPIVIELFKFNAKETYDWQTIPAVSVTRINLQENNLVYTFADLTPAFYAIRAYQDTNNNQQLDKTDSGVPIEPVAFSNNPSLFSGEPTPNECILYIENDSVVNLKFKIRRTKKKRKKH